MLPLRNLFCVAAVLTPVARSWPAGAEAFVCEDAECDVDEFESLKADDIHAEMADLMQSDEVSFLQGSLKALRRQQKELLAADLQEVSLLQGSLRTLPRQREEALAAEIQEAPHTAEEPRLSNLSALATGSAITSTAGSPSAVASNSSSPKAVEESISAVTLATATIAAGRALVAAEAEAENLQNYTTAIIGSLMGAARTDANMTATAEFAEAAATTLDKVALSWMSANGALEGAVAVLTGALSLTGRNNLSRELNTSLVGALAPLLAFSAQLEESRAVLARVAHDATPGRLETALRGANLSLQVGLVGLSPASEGLSDSLQALSGKQDEDALAALAGLRRIAPPLAGRLLREAELLAAGVEDALRRLPQPGHNGTAVVLLSEAAGQSRSASSRLRPSWLAGLWAAAAVTILARASATC